MDYHHRQQFDAAAGGSNCRATLGSAQHHSHQQQSNHHHHQQQQQQQQHQPYRSGSPDPGATGGATNGGLLLGTQYRRHSASLSAAPIRGSNFAEGRPARSSSWAPESPGKKYSKGGGAAAGGGSVLKSLLFSFFSMNALRRNRKELLLWVMMICGILVGYKLWSDGGFSAILTLSSCFQCFAMVLLLVKVAGQRSVIGVSRRTVWLITISLCSRLCSTLFYNGYLPVDRSGDWVYQAADALSVLLCVLLLVHGATVCRSTQQQQADKDTCWVLLPCAAASVLGVLLHPTLNQHFLADVSWTVGLYIETFAMVPQLWLMTKLGGEVEALTSHFMASMSASKFFAWLFWYFSYTELVPRAGGRNYAGWAVIVSYSAQTILFIDFLYYYLKSLRNGKTLIIDF